MDGKINKLDQEFKNIFEEMGVNPVFLLFLSIDELSDMILDQLSYEEINEYKWGLYHRKNSSAWMSEILGKIKYENIDNEKELKEGN